MFARCCIQLSNANLHPEESRRDCCVLTASFVGCIGLWKVNKTWSGTNKAPNVKLILQRKVPAQNFEGVTYELLALMLLQTTGGRGSVVLCGDNSGSVNVFATQFLSDYQKIDQAHIRSFAAHGDAIGFPSLAWPVTETFSSRAVTTAAFVSGKE